MLTFQPLSKENIEEAIQLVHSVFKYEAGLEDNPGKAYRTSLELEKHKDTMDKWGVKKLQYFVAKENETGPIVGVTGWYIKNDSREDTVWLGWYCVNPAQRGKGYGQEILEWTMSKVKEGGFKTLKLYTSTDPNEATAQILYEKLGFKITEEQDDPNSGFKILYREKKL